MDSRSGPELSIKFHAFDETVKRQHPDGAAEGHIRRTWVGPLILAWVVACGGGNDPRDLEGALARAADALAQRDTQALFRVIDQRARHALASIAQSKRAAAELIRQSYPARAQPVALAELGEAAHVKDAATLFGLRCGATCLDDLSGRVGAPAQIRNDGDEVVVTTPRGGQLRLFRGSDTWYGIVWNTDALHRERDRAAAELAQVQANALLYGAMQHRQP